VKAPLLVRFFDKLKLADFRKNSARPRKSIRPSLEQLEDRTLSRIGRKSLNQLINRTLQSAFGHFPVFSEPRRIAR